MVADAAGNWAMTTVSMGNVQVGVEGTVTWPIPAGDTPWRLFDEDE